ncbi:MAG: hypothetical protein V2A79_02575 [Planctomycetota bacterium]
MSQFDSFRVKKGPAPDEWLIKGGPEIDVSLLHEAYPNISVRPGKRLGAWIIEATEGSLPDAKVEEAIYRLYAAIEIRGETDSKPPVTWMAIHKLTAEATPEAFAVARRYASWNLSMLRQLWDQAEHSPYVMDHHDLWWMKEHADARVNIQDVLFRMLANAPPPGPLC